MNMLNPCDQTGTKNLQKEEDNEMMRRLTHKWHRPWTCHRRSEQRRIPSKSISNNVRLKMDIKMGISYRFNLARVNLNDPDASGNELLSQALSEASDSSLGGAVD